MPTKLREIILELERKLNVHSSGLVRFGLSLWLLLLYIVLGIYHVYAVLFLPATHSFQRVNFLDTQKGYTSSYSGHLRLKHNLRFATLAYSLVLITGIVFVNTAVQIINPEQFGQAAFASNFVVNSAADTNDGVCDVTNCTLREAIANANPNDTITFAAAYTITLTQALPALSITGLTLNGVVGSSTVTIDCNHVVDVGVQVNTSTVTVKNLTVQHCNTFGVEVLSGANNFIISTVRLDSNVQDGLKVRSGTGGSITDVTSSSNTGRGLVVIGRTGLSISGSTFQSNTQSGIALEGGASAAFIDSNSILLNGEDGIRISGNSNTPTISNNFIGTDSSFTNGANTGNGIALSDATGASITGNVIGNNVSAGLALSNVSNSTVTNNQIGVYSGSHVANGSSAISVTAGSAHNIINSNSLYATGVASVLAVTGSGTNANDLRNNIYYNTLASTSIVVSNGAASSTTPVLSSWSGDTVVGSSSANAVIDIYSYATGSRLVSTTADAAGSWTSTDPGLSNATGLAVMATTDTGSSSFVVLSSQNLTISNITVVAITTTTATVTWDTNVASDTEVSYQPNDASQPILQSSNAAAVTSHSLTITELLPGTTYDCTVTSIDSANANNYNSSTDCSFTTAAETTAVVPTISSIAVSAITAHTAQITWLSNVATYSRVDYGTTTDYTLLSTDDTATTNHVITLTDLVQNTTYHYAVTISNDSGQSITSEDLTFTTDNYLDAVVSTIEIRDSQHNVTTVTSDTTTITLPTGALRFKFTDTDKSLTGDKLRLMIALVQKHAVAVFDKTKQFTSSHHAQFIITKDTVQAGSTYKVKTGLVDPNGGYLNASGLKKRFTFTVQDVPQLLAPSLINYRMPASFVVSSKTEQVTVYLKTTTGKEVLHCVAKISESIGECQPPFSVTQGQYVVQLVDAAGGSSSQDLYISTIVPSGVLVTDDRSSSFTSRILYTGNPTLTGITTAGHTIEVYIPQIKGAMLADVVSAKAGTATPWQFTLHLTTLPQGLTTFTIIDRRADGTVAHQMTYPVLRTPRAVQPAVIAPDNNQKFANIAPVIQVIGPSDHTLDVFNSADKLLLTTGFSNGGAQVNLSQWFTTPGQYTVHLRNHNSIGLPSAETIFTFTVYHDNYSDNDSIVATPAFPVVEPDSDTVTPKPVQPALDIPSLEQTLQADAQAEDLHYPAITTTTIELADAEHNQVQKALTDSIKNSTNFAIVPGDGTNVITIHREFSITDWFGGRAMQQPETTNLVLSGQLNLPTTVQALPSYVVVSLFSTPIVKIAEVDAHGRWTMTVPAELLSTGNHTAYAAAEVDGIQGDQVQVAKFVIQQKNTLSNTTWLVIINIIIAFVAIVVSIVLQLKRRQNNRLTLTTIE